MKHIIDTLRTDESLAFWRAAQSFLFETSHDLDAALAAVEAAHGHGLNADEIDRIRDHVCTLFLEGQRRKESKQK